MNMGLALWLIFEFVFFFFGILHFEIFGSFFFFFEFCIFEIFGSYFFVFCIFEKLRLYLSCIFFGKKTKIQHK